MVPSFLDINCLMAGIPYTIRAHTRSLIEPYVLHVHNAGFNHPSEVGSAGSVTHGFCTSLLYIVHVRGPVVPSR